MATTNDYIKLIPSENREKPKFTEMIQAVTGCFVDLNNASSVLPEKFDLDTAVGAQLDVLGIWIGLTRYVKIPLANIYFSFDTTGLGLDQGNWIGQFDSLDGLTALDDGTYRTMLKAKIGANHWDGTLAGYKTVMEAAFSEFGVTVIPYDNQDMTMEVYIFGAVLPAIVISLLENGYLLMKPEGVHINGYHIQPVFGFDQNDAYFAGFDVGYYTGHN